MTDDVQMAYAEKNSIKKDILENCRIKATLLTVKLTAHVLPSEKWFVDRRHIYVKIRNIFDFVEKICETQFPLPTWHRRDISHWVDLRGFDPYK